MLPGDSPRQSMKLKHLLSRFLTFMPLPHPSSIPHCLSCPSIFIQRGFSGLCFTFYPQLTLRKIFTTSSRRLHPCLELINYIFPLGLLFYVLVFVCLLAFLLALVVWGNRTWVSLNARQMPYHWSVLSGVCLLRLKRHSKRKPWRCVWKPHGVWSSILPLAPVTGVRIIFIWY